MNEKDSLSALWRMVDESMAGLSVSDRLAVRAAIANSVLEGWQPTKVEVDRLVAFAAGAITIEHYRALVLSNPTPQAIARTTEIGNSTA